MVLLSAISLRFAEKESQGTWWCSVFTEDRPEEFRDHDQCLFGTLPSGRIRLQFTLRDVWSDCTSLCVLTAGSRLVWHSHLWIPVLVLLTALVVRRLAGPKWLFVTTTAAGILLMIGWFLLATDVNSFYVRPRHLVLGGLYLFVALDMGLAFGGIVACCVVLVAHVVESLIGLALGENGQER